MKPIAIFGGTFDPIHFGHLRCALEIVQQVPLQTLRFLPCAEPVHKANAHASPQQRLAMLRLALESHPQFSVDEREIHRDTPSYTQKTLQELRQEQPETPLCFIMGMDSFNDLHSWHQWQDIPKLAHLIVVARPGSPIKLHSQVARLFAERKIQQAQQLQQQPAGHIIMVEITALNISATHIRQQIQQGLDASYLLPDNVWHYIQQQQLYRITP